jgi:hypothetical protein
MKYCFYIIVIFFPTLLVAFSGKSRGHFIENKGQWPDEVRFLSKKSGTNTWITNEGIVYDYYILEKYEIKREDFFSEFEYEAADSVRRKGHIVRMTFDGGYFSKDISGYKKVETYYNYFLGNDASKWARYVPAYEEVRISEVYNGIAALLYYDNGSMRYDIIAEPFADISQLIINFEGSEGISINEEGELLIETSIGTVKHGSIYAYQVIDGQKNEVDCRFEINSENTVCFNIGDYNPTLALVIDPLVFSTFIGSGECETDRAVSDIILDSLKNVYKAGVTKSDNYPISTGAYDESFNGGRDIFLNKLSSDGSTLIFSTYIGGNQEDSGPYIAFNKSNNIYLTALSGSDNFPITAEAFDETYNGGFDVVVCKFNSDASELYYSTYIGGSGHEYNNSIMIDSLNNIYIAGHTYSGDYPVTKGVFDDTFNGVNDSFISKISSDCSEMIFSTFIGGKLRDYGVNYSLDKQNNIVFCGFTTSTDYPTTSNSYDATYHGGFDSFITKINSDGTKLLYSTYIGGNNDDWARSLVLDDDSNIYIAGFTKSQDFPTTTGSYQENFDGNGQVVFICKMNQDLSELNYSTFLGLENDDLTRFDRIDIKLDPFDNLLILGHTNSDEFPTTTNAFDNTYNGGSSDIFLSQLNFDGSIILYSSFIGGSETDYGHAFVIDDEYNIYITGSTQSNDFPSTPGVFDESFNPESSPFVMKLTIDEPRPCDETAFEYPWFDSTANLNFVRNAQICEKNVRLTSVDNHEGEENQAGAAWYNDKLPLKNGFETEFIFRISEGGGDTRWDNTQPGGDGFALVIQNTGINECGGIGGGIGYCGIKNSIAIEFDMFRYTSDPNNNHVAVQSNGSDANTEMHNGDACLGIVDNIIEIKSDGSQIYHVKIDYNVLPNTLRIFLDTNGIFESPVLVVESLKLAELLTLDNGKAYIGFTAATYAAYENHDILSWSVCPFDNCSDYQVDIIAESNFHCEGDSVILKTANEYDEYEWSTGEKNREICVKEEGIYYVNVYDSQGCPGTDSIEVIVYPNPKASINPNGKITICEGDSITLSASPTGEDYEYMWSTGETSSSIIAKRTGKYSVKIESKYGCEGTSDTVEINFISSQISYSLYNDDNELYYDTTFFGELYCKQIELYNTGNEDIILENIYLKINTDFSIPQSQLPLTIEPDETVMLMICFTPSDFGVHRDTLIIEDVCQSISIPLLAVGDGQKFMGSEKCGIDIIIKQKAPRGKNGLIFSMTPNPFSQLTIINYELRMAGNVSLILYDMLGNEVAVLVDEYKEAGRDEVRLDGSGFAPGVYFYVFRSVDRIESGKIIHIK